MSAGTVQSKRSWIMTDRVEINAGVMQGKPVIRGTPIPVELLLRKLAEGAIRSTAAWVFEPTLNVARTVSGIIV